MIDTQGHLRVLVETFYDVQNFRTSADNRLRKYGEQAGLTAILGSPRVKELRREGPTAYAKTVNKHKDEPQYLIAAEEAKAAFTDWSEEISKRMNSSEDYLKRTVLQLIEDEPLWSKWLIDVNGIGPCLAGGLMAWVDIAACPHVSSLWKYLGMSVIIDKHVCSACGAERSDDAAEVCPDCEAKWRPVGHAEKVKRGEKAGYNPKGKVLCFKIGDSFVKQKGVYRNLYDTTRAQIEGRIAANGGFCGKKHMEGGKLINGGKCFDAHVFAMSKRKTVKLFLSHVFCVWRTLRGLPVTPPHIFNPERMGEKAHSMASFVPPLRDKGAFPEEIRKVWEAWGK